MSALRHPPLETQRTIAEIAAEVAPLAAEVQQCRERCSEASRRDTEARNQLNNTEARLARVLAELDAQTKGLLRLGKG